MLNIDFRNLMSETIGDENGLGKKDLDSLGKLVPAAHMKFKEWRASKDALFYDIVFDDEILEGIADAARSVSARFENVVALGIGGSALGLRCIAGALLPPLWNLRDGMGRNHKPRLFVCDNIDPETFAAIMELIDLRKTCFVVISKSGRTTETAAQFFIVLERLRKFLGDDWKERVVVITDPASGELRPMVREEGLLSFSIPTKLGGRYSVLSPVGLFPAACTGIDIDGLVEGARAMAKLCAGESLDGNPAYRIGGYHFWLDAKKKRNIGVMIPYADGLALAADWYAQLWAESLGKDGKGQTPVKALGATDQHSQVQLYMEGPSDKVITFVGVKDFRVLPTATQIAAVPKAFEYLKGHDLGGIIRAEQAATASALAKAGRPNLTVTFPVLDAHHLGEFFMLYEIACAFAGALYGINPFDQPGVELGKKLTREMLTRR